VLLAFGLLRAQLALEKAPVAPRRLHKARFWEAPAMRRVEAADEIFGELGLNSII
jgi:hypothetical protein